MAYRAHILLLRLCETMRNYAKKLDLPGHCYGSSKNGPYGPQGPWAQPLFDCVAMPSGGFFSGKSAVPKIIMRIY